MPSAIITFWQLELGMSTLLNLHVAAKTKPPILVLDRFDLNTGVNFGVGFRHTVDY